MIFPTGKGSGLTYKAHTALIAEWVKRWSYIDTQERQTRAKRPRKSRKVLQMGVTEEGAGGRWIEGRDETAIHEEGPEKEPCPCNVPSRCLVHDDLFKREAGPSIDEEPAKLTPVNQELANTIPAIPEPAPAQRELPESPVREGCTCGTGIDCQAHN
jgi:hypothetical protein